MTQLWVRYGHRAGAAVEQSPVERIVRTQGYGIDRRVRHFRDAPDSAIFSLLDSPVGIAFQYQLERLCHVDELAVVLPARGWVAKSLLYVPVLSRKKTFPHERKPRHNLGACVCRALCYVWCIDTALSRHIAQTARWRSLVRLFKSEAIVLSPQQPSAFASDSAAHSDREVRPP